MVHEFSVAEEARQHGQRCRRQCLVDERLLGAVVVVAPKRASVVTSKPAKSAAAASFVELIASPSATRAECVIEFESAIGGKMRIQWKGSSAPDWTSLLRAWREAER